MPIVLRKFTTCALCIVFYMYTATYFSLDTARGKQILAVFIELDDFSCQSIHDFRNLETENRNNTVAFQETNSFTNGVYCIKSVSLLPSLR